MKNLATYVEERDGVKVVDSRKIHEFLGVKTPHRKWIVRKIEELSLESGKDYVPDKIVRRVNGRNGGGSVTENIFLLTQRAAEHLGMAETTDKGVEIRDAFIAARDARKKQLETDFERKSKEARKGLASQWAQHGLQGRDFAVATVKEYEVAFGDKDIRKGVMDTKQKAILTIFELTESLKLDASPHIHGIEDVKYSLEDTGRALTTTFQKLRIR